MMKLKRKNNPLEEENEELTDEELNEEETNPEENDDLFNEDLNDDYFGEVAPPPIKKHNDLLKSLTDFSVYIKDCVNGWLGISWNEQKKEFTSVEGIKPIMNIKGATWCASALKTYVRDNNIITDIGRQEFNNIICDFIEYSWLNIGIRSKEFGIKKEGDILRVCNEMEHAVSLILMGAGDGKYNKFLGETVTRSEHINNPGTMYPNQMRNNPKLGTLERIKKVFFGA